MLDLAHHYPAFLADGQPTYQAASTAVERAWLTYRGAHCASVSLALGGTVYADVLALRTGRASRDLFVTQQTGAAALLGLLERIAAASDRHSAR